jgi:putative ABC transport system permease protein
VGLLEDILPPGFRFAPFRPLTHISLDMRVFMFALAVSGITALLCGLAPALSAQRHDLNEPLKEGGGRGATQTGGKRVRHALVMAEVALTLVVLVAAGLMIDSVSRLLGVEPGFKPHNVVRMDITTPQVNLYYSPPVNPRFCQQIEENIGAVPGVLSASAASHLPFEGMASRGLTIEGEPDPGPEHQPGAKYSIACPNYLRTMGVSLLAGREFTDRDTADAPGVIVISEAMARRYWPKKDALGARVKIGRFDSDAPWLTIVGIARDVRTRGLDRQPPVEFFRPFMQAGWPTMTIVVRTNANALSFAEPIKAAVALTNPDVPVSDVETLDSVLESSVASRRFPMLLLSAFAGLGLVLAAVGIYGVVAYGVTQQTHEIGIRMAFGARPADVLRLVVGASMVWTLSGVVIGILGSLGATKLLVGLLFGVSAKDPFVLAGVALLLTFVALLATVIPARRAMRVDPMVALRYE